MAAVKNGSLLAAVVVVMVAAAELVGHADAATHVVRDALGWRVPPSGAKEYADWASQHVFAVGDVLVFNFTTARHDVALVTKDSFDACNTNTPLGHFTEGPASITLNSTGDNYYICTFDSHCLSGQKLAINVTGTASPPSPRSPGGSSQSPPPSSTAVVTTCTSFVVIISSLIYGLVAL